MSKHKANIAIIALCVGVIRSWASASPLTILQNLYTTAKEMDTMQNMHSPTSIGGIYDAQLGMASDATIVGGVQALQTIHQHYSTREFCTTNTAIIDTPRPLQVTDILTILIRSQGTMDRMQTHTRDQQSLSDLQNNLTDSCRALLTCMGEQRLDIRLCTDTVAQDYEHHSLITHHQQKMISDFYGKQFFNNGTLDDSSYDLLVDMQLISEIMFGETKDAPEILYYRMPEAAGGGSGAPIIPSTPSTDQSDTSPNNTNNSPSPTITIGSGNQNPNNTDPTDTNNLIQPTKPTNTTTDSTSTNTSTTPSSPTSTNTQLFGGTVCIDPQVSTMPEQISTNPFSDSTLTPTQIDAIRSDYQSYINGNYTTYTPTNTPIEAPSSPRGTGENMSIGSALQDLNMMQEIQACIDQCDTNHNGIDALVCKAGCMCDTIPKSSNNDIARYLDYKIKFCRVPSQSEPPYNNATKVHSIEEIIDAINSTLTALRQSGALHKRNETQEYLDTTLSNLKLGDSFVFSFNVATKKSPNTRTQSDLQKEADQMFDQATKGSMIYSINPDTYTLKPTDTSYDPDQITQTTQKLYQAMESSITIQQQMSTTLMDHYTFWQQVGTQIDDLRTLSASMKRTAESAP